MTARRGFLRGLGALPFAATAPSLLAFDAPAATEDDLSAADALDRLERLAAAVVARLRALDARVPSARAFLGGALRDHERLARERRVLRRRLHVPPATPAEPGTGAPDLSLAGLREAQDALVYAHAEALPALRNPAAVDRLARHLVELARHLTVIDLWIEAETERG